MAPMRARPACEMSAVPLAVVPAALTGTSPASEHRRPISGLAAPTEHARLRHRHPDHRRWVPQSFRQHTWRLRSSAIWTSPGSEETTSAMTAESRWRWMADRASSAARRTSLCLSWAADAMHAAQALAQTRLSLIKVLITTTIRYMYIATDSDITCSDQEIEGSASCGELKREQRLGARHVWKHLRAAAPGSLSSGATAVNVSMAAVCAFVLFAPPTAAVSVDRNVSALITPDSTTRTLNNARVVKYIRRMKRATDGAPGFCRRSKGLHRLQPQAACGQHKDPPHGPCSLFEAELQRMTTGEAV